MSPQNTDDIPVRQLDSIVSMIHQEVQKLNSYVIGGISFEVTNMKPTEDFRDSLSAKWELTEHGCDMRGAPILRVVMSFAFDIKPKFTEDEF